MNVVDFHMHFFSAPFFEALAAQAPGADAPQEQLARLAERTGIELPSADLGEHLARWTAEMDRHEVQHMAAFASLPEEVPAVAEAAARADGRLTPFALVNPRVEGVPARVRALIEEKGFGGVLVFPAMHHFHVAGPVAAGLLEVLNEYAATVFVHCGLLVVKLRDLLGLPRPQDLSFANPLGLIPAANAWPRVHFVIPHFGAGFLRETLMAGSMCPNVYVDTSSSNGWIATQAPDLTLTQVFERTLDVFGPQRVLFGTDSNVFPAGWRADRRDEQLEALASLETPAADVELIFGGNARRLLEARG